MEYIPYFVVGTLFAYLVIHVISKGGMRAALLGAEIRQTAGEIRLSTGSVRNELLRVHRLKDGNIALERTVKGGLGFSTTSVTLKPGQAEALRELLKIV